MKGLGNHVNHDKILKSSGIVNLKYAKSYPQQKIKHTYNSDISNQEIRSG